jgi:hypothetical protein
MAGVPSPSFDPSSIFGMIPKNPESAKFLSKLLDSVGDAIGLIYRPIHIKMMAKAQVTVAITKAKGDADVAKIQAATEGDVEVIRINQRDAIREARDRAKERVTRQEERRQNNLEAITIKAALEEPDSVSEEPVEPDWLSQFINQAQDVSDEDMQTIWGRILAGEVAEPGTYSLRTLAFLKMLRKKDAELITRFCSMVWLVDGYPVPIVPHRDQWPEEFLTLFPSQALEHLDHIGFIKSSSGPALIIDFDVYKLVMLEYFGEQFPMHWKLTHVPSQRTSTFPIGPAMLTDIGNELVPIAGGEPNLAYRVQAISLFQRHGWAYDPGVRVREP